MRFAVVRLLTEMRSMLACRRGQVAIIFAFAATMLVLAIGTGVDLWQAYAMKARLQSAVDAAALAIASTDRQNYTAAQLILRAQAYVTANYPASALGTLQTPPPSNLLSYPTPNTINVTDSASVPTTFMRIIGVPSLSVSAIGQAKAAWPNIDFYLLLDSSPSMGIAASTAGIATMVANTLQQCDSPPAGAGNPTCGCGFACHETNPAADNSCPLPWSATVSYVAGNYVYVGTSSSGVTYSAKIANTNHTPPNSTYWNVKSSATPPTCIVPGLGNAGGIDNYQLAKNLGVTLRIDNLRTAAADLMTTAQNTETTFSLTNAYRMAIYTFDINFNTILAISNFTTLSAAATAAQNITQLTMYSNNHLTSGDSNSDADTNYDNAMTQINNIMPAPGQGTRSPGDTPKEILFFVTDGEEDEKPTGGCTASATSTCSGSRQMSVMDPALCTTIKNRGILIAVLYTQYLPLPTNGWYNTYVSPYQPSIATSLQSCASPNLYTEVLTGGDISAALSQLFITAVNSVFLSQ